MMMIIGERDYHPDIVSYPSGALLRKVYTTVFEQSEPEWLAYVYEYTSGQVSREEKYSDGECYEYTTHTYKDDLLITSATYRTKSAAEDPGRIIRYYYDMNHHLVHSTHEELFIYSSMMSFSTWYEYE
jgi:hypothetical protein